MAVAHRKKQVSAVGRENNNATGLAAGFRISSIPTLMAFREGILVFSQPGALPPAGLEQVITAVEALDMDEVRAEIEKQRTDAPA